MPGFLFCNELLLGSFTPRLHVSRFRIYLYDCLSHFHLIPKLNATGVLDIPRETTVHSQGIIEIDRLIEDVFPLTCDHVAEWSLTVIEDEVLEEKPEGVGTTFRVVTEEHGKQMVFQGVITRYEPPYLNAMHLTGKMFDIEAEYTFEDISERTRVTLISNVTGKGFFKVFLFLFGWMMNKSSCQATQKELESLKSFCEESAWFDSAAT